MGVEFPISLSLISIIYLLFFSKTENKVLKLIFLFAIFSNILLMFSNNIIIAFYINFTFFVFFLILFFIFHFFDFLKLISQLIKNLKKKNY